VPRKIEATSDQGGPYWICTLVFQSQDGTYSYTVLGDLVKDSPAPGQVSFGLLQKDGTWSKTVRVVKLPTSKLFFPSVDDSSPSLTVQSSSLAFSQPSSQMNSGEDRLVSTAPMYPPEIPRKRVFSGATPTPDRSEKRPKANEIGSFRPIDSAELHDSEQLETQYVAPNVNDRARLQEMATRYEPSASRTRTRPPTPEPSPTLADGTPSAPQVTDEERVKKAQLRIQNMEESADRIRKKGRERINYQANLLEGIADEKEARLKRQNEREKEKDKEIEKLEQVLDKLKQGRESF